MDDGAVMLLAVLIPCLVATLAVAIILYRVFYRDWLGRCLHSGTRVGRIPSEQEQQQDGISNGNGNNSVDVEALRGHDNPSVVFSHARPARP